MALRAVELVRDREGAVVEHADHVLGERPEVHVRRLGTVIVLEAALDGADGPHDDLDGVGDQGHWWPAGPSARRQAGQAGRAVGNNSKI